MLSAGSSSSCQHRSSNQSDVIASHKDKIRRVEHFQDALDLIFYRPRNEHKSSKRRGVHREPVILRNDEEVEVEGGIGKREISSADSDVIFIADCPHSKNNNIDGLTATNCAAEGTSTGGLVSETTVTETNNRHTNLGCKYDETFSALTGVPKAAVKFAVSAPPRQKRPLKDALESGQQVEETRTASATPRISVCVRGNITKKMFEIWKTKLQDIDKKVVVTESFGKQTTCIVLPNPPPTVSAMEQWCFNQVELLDTVPCVHSDWIVNSIKQNQLLPFDAYRTSSASGKTAPKYESIARSVKMVECDAANQADAPSPPQLTRQERNERWLENNKEKFACSVSGTSAAAKRQNNTHITEVFDQLNEMYDLVGDDFRANVYKRASGMLASMAHISDVNEVRNIRGIGKSLRDKIDEILETGSLKKLQAFNVNPRIVAVTELCKIWGIGAKTADVLIKKYGIMSIDDLEKRGKPYLTPQQLIGLERHKELSVRIPRDEITRIEKFVAEYANRYILYYSSAHTRRQLTIFAAFSQNTQWCSVHRLWFIPQT
jgi:hypothetical protein